MPRILHIDFETYSEANIAKAGTWAYSCHRSTEVLMMAWAFDDEKPAIWLPGEPLPTWNAALSKEKPGFQVCAWNDFFELCIFRNVLHWSVPEAKYWIDAAASAATLALPRSLKGCGDALGLDVGEQKDSKGSDLIKLFSVPLKRKGASIRRCPEEYPGEFEMFKEYCIQDVIAERAIYKKLRPLSAGNRVMWLLDRNINLRGLRFDMEAVKDAIHIKNDEISRVVRDAAEFTKGGVTNIMSPSQVVSYLRRLGVKAENSQKEYLKRLVATLDESTPSQALAVRVINARLSVAKSSLAKYDKLALIASTDNRAYGLLRWHGAGTGRWAGNLFQPQNLPRPSFKDGDVCIQLFRYRDPEVIKVLYGDTLEALSSTIRSTIRASEGCRLIVSDYSQIESRLLKWHAGDDKGLDVYRQGKDIYKFNAAAAFKVPYERVTSDQRLIGKVIELACGYQGSVGAFSQFADVYGVVIPENEAKQLIDTWRKSNKAIVSFWYALDAAAVNAVKNQGAVYQAGGAAFKVVGTGRLKFLCCKLRSGRVITYHRPFLSVGKFGNEQVGYYGVDSTSKKYGRKDTYGGKLAENITQALAYDLLANAMINLDAAGYPIVLTVHDEVVADVPLGHGSLDGFNRILCDLPNWAKGLPIEAAGYEADRYRK